ncbi:hypothetical protein I4I73_05215 [Pseudonocardia sp. KRD-184]|uniref:Uncharacterized protein n=1 Tax=Pseudonocardia oceani TaxID=2792013 RepID=A0ABS6U6S8_9PSEU|nr:hypothetical protein [Pseudonocardia oceani]MBW0089797.1 hypothetical protein [Pseudonocardia oceani]MBW0095393.1 hypothetical protein [Pseudonocardia oceani]MBW0108806.1 hypothetical protein [Pseudonocardia oceani]MBW0122207.1 hypothetical protein [Pseudonocardia oceani]MBW0127935.1 hypothetical protein [Pseudonocardia oceani]
MTRPTRRTVPPPVPLADAVAPDRERHRDLIDAALDWLAAHDREAEPDLLALVCAVADHRQGSPTRWSRTDVTGALRADLSTWCSRRRCLVPDGVPEAMWSWFDALHATGRLDPTSDPLAELRKPLCCAGGLDQDGRPLSAGAPRQVECECLLPYRETAALLGALVRLAEHYGGDPLGPLRRLVGDDSPELPPWTVSGP